MYDIVTFGSAAWDVFMRSRSIKAVKSKKFISSKGICFNLGSKIDISEIYSYSGGGGTNTAATFSLQGFKTRFCGMVADDLAGKQVVEDLKGYNIDTSLVFKTKDKPTNYSVILKTSRGKDRTILVFRGASELLTKRDINWKKLSSCKWFYLSPLSGKLALLTKEIVFFAKKKGIKVAFNPGNSQLSLPKKELNSILKKVDILFLNQEEASMLTSLPYNKEKDIFKKIDDLCPGIAVMTKGPEGVVVADGKNIFSAPGVKENIIDNTGAGDAFGSGFVAEYIRSGGEIEKSIQFGLNNSISCIGRWGAKGGLLKKKSKPRKAKITKEACSGHNCKVK